MKEGVCMSEEYRDLMNKLGEELSSESSNSPLSEISAVFLLLLGIGIVLKLFALLL